MQEEDRAERFTTTLSSIFDASSHTEKCPGKTFNMAKKDSWGHLGNKRMQVCFIIFDLYFQMVVVSSRKVKVNFALVRAHESNLLLVALSVRRS